MLAGQTVGNQSLSGKYFFRYVTILTDNSGSVTDARSVIGTLTFDSAGKFTFSGQGLQGASTAAFSQSGSGTYAVDASGMVTLDSPLRTGDKINARYGPEALIGSGTETSDNSFDLLVAAPAPANGSNATFGGTYTTVSLEFPGASTANVRNAIFSLGGLALGQLSPISVYGHTPGIASGAPTTQTINGATYALAADGTGSLTFGTSSSLLSGNRTMYMSADGNVIIGGSTSAGGHDILIGVRQVINIVAATWKGNFWLSGMRFDSGYQPPWFGYAGSVVAGGAGSATRYRRIKSLANPVVDETSVQAYSANSNGQIAVEGTLLGLGGGSTIVGAGISSDNPSGYEIYFGAQMPPLSGSGVFLNPQGVVSAAGFAPTGNPISPGEFIALYGTGLAKSTQTAAPPYPTSVNNVTVTINGKLAPIYFVSSGQINCLVPYGTTGATAAIVVTNGTTASNSVTVPVALTSPGVYSLDSSGSGNGAILHADFSVVNAASPAIPGETVLIYLTGMGAVSPTVPDGTAGKGSPLSNSVTPSVYVAGLAATVVYSGLAPGFPGLYQINVTIPKNLAFSGNLPLAIQTANAFHDQVFIPVL